MEGNVSPVEISNCSGASRPDLKEINALLATSFRGAVAARVRDAQREGDVAT
jgi:TetR/AcrR family transcriptional regulator, transcriptional repressor for nem operon